MAAMSQRLEWTTAPRTYVAGDALGSAFNPESAVRAAVAQFATRWLLSTREVDVLGLMVEGLRPKEIAARLGLSLPTVQTFRVRIWKKLGVDGAERCLAVFVQFLATRAGD